MKRVVAGTMLLALCGLSGCIVAPAPGPYYYGGAPAYYAPGYAPAPAYYGAYYGGWGGGYPRGGYHRWR